MADTVGTMRSWIDGCDITARALDGQPTHVVYDEYQAWTHIAGNRALDYNAWLSTMAALLPALTLETREESDGRTQTYFATMAVD